MLTRVVKFLDQYNIISVSQFGFRKGLSTEAAILELTESILKQLDSRGHVASILCDLCKAFDCVDHKILLRKLHFYGIRGIAHAWFRSYLENRKQCVEYSGNHYGIYRSPWKVCARGVPQGSILGPLLFLIYINDLPRNIDDSNAVLFADDTTLTVLEQCGISLEISANRIFKRANDWFAANGLKLNTGKTQVIQFGTKRVNTNLKINGAEEISNCQSAKFLGVEIDQNLNWKAHVKNLQTKLSSASYALRVISNATSRQIVLTSYYGYIYPHLRYGVVFWGNSTHSDKIFKIQKSCIRIICNLSYREPCKPYFRELGILTLPSLYIYEVLRMCRRGLSGAEYLLSSSMRVGTC